MGVPARDPSPYGRWLEAGNDEIPSADVQILTSGGRKIDAHCSVLAWASPVLESMLDRRGNFSCGKTISILGVPCDAVTVFVRFLYSARSVTNDEMAAYAMQLLVLSHAYRVPRLKRTCEAALAAALVAESVVDALQLARLCDAPRLIVRCLRLIGEEFAAVERTEAWAFLQAHDPWLELDILQFLQDSDMKVKRRRRKREAQEVYLQLSEAMECLEHICTKGCTEVGPHDSELSDTNRLPCVDFKTCRSVQLLIKHLAYCDRKPRCARCKRVWQLLRLHSYICDRSSSCKVPLCAQFKLRSQNTDEDEKRGGDDDQKWRTLAKRVGSVRVMSAIAKRKREYLAESRLSWKKRM